MHKFIILVVATLITLFSVIAGAQTQDTDNKTFDDEGKLVQEIDPQGKRVHYIYDEEGRLVAKSYEDGTVVKIPSEQ